MGCKLHKTFARMPKKKRKKGFKYIIKERDHGPNESVPEFREVCGETNGLSEDIGGLG